MHYARPVATYLGKLIGLVPGAKVLWSAGLGTIVGSLVAGLLAIASSLPLWSIALAGVGTFLVIADGAPRVASWVQESREPPARKALTAVIDAGVDLADRMREVTDEEPPPGERERWKVLSEDWERKATDTIDRMAHDRLAGFTVPVIIGNAASGAQPRWIADEIHNLEFGIEKVRQIRGSL
jgi:hypothetical protein